MMKTVAICGSRRFKAEIKEFSKKLREFGVLVFEPYFDHTQEEWARLWDDYKKFVVLELTHEHFYKIQMADVVFVYNKDGYVGNSTTLEIGYAVALGKPIYALNSDEEFCRQVLFRGIISSPEEFIKRLR